jgi:heme exporter protein D
VAGRDDARVPPPFLRRDAAAWSRNLVPWWVPAVVLVLGWLAAVTLSVATVPLVCSAADPSVCGPDRFDAIAAVALFSTPLLLWWMPVGGLVAGVSFALLDTASDPVQVSRVGWLGFGVACLLVLWLHVQDVDRQRHLTRRLAGGDTRLAPGTRALGWDLRIVLAATLALTGVGLLVHFQALTRAEAVHVQDAERVVATVFDWDAAEHRAVLVGPDNLPRTLRTLAAYPVGDTQPALVDPHDPAWLRLVAEPQDDTLWLTAGLTLILLAALVLGRCLAVRRHRAALTGRPRTGLGVLVDSDGVRTELYAADARPGDPPFAVLGTMLAGAADRVERAADIDHRHGDGERFRVGPDPAATRERRPGIVLGEVHEGSWPAVVVDDDVLLAATPLRAPRTRPAWLGRG